MYTLLFIFHPLTDERECGDSAEGPQLPEVQGALPLRHEGPGARPDRGDRDAAGDNHWGQCNTIICKQI